MADSTQYAIEIAARLQDGGAAIAQLQEIAASLSGAGTAATAAAAAVAAGQAAYAQAESAADRAARAVERIGAAADAQRGKLQAAMDAGDDAKAARAAAALSALVEKQAAAASRAQAAAAALAAEGAALDALKAKSASASDAQKSLVAQQEQMQAQVKAAAKAQEAADQASAGSGNLREAAMSLGRLGGPLGEVGSKAFGAANAVSKLRSSLGSAGPYVAIAAAILLIATAIVSATVAAVEWSVGLADARRNEQLTVEGLAASSASLKNLGAILPAVQASTGLATGELAKMAEQLAAAGVKASAMPDALRAIATATAGGASAEFLAKLNAELKNGSKSAAQLAAEVDAKFGPIVAKKMLSLDSIAARLKTGISSIFGGLEIDGLLEALSRLVGMFNASSAVGQTLKFLFETIFQPLVDAAARAIPTVEAAIIQLAIYALKAYVAAKQLAKAFDISGANVALYAVYGVLGAIVGVCTGLVVILGVVAVAMFLAFLPAILIIAAVIAIIYGVYTVVMMIVDAVSSAGSAIKGAFGSALAYLSSIDLASIGSDMIAGLARGIAAGAGAVLSAITGVVSGAVKGAEALLGIASPSKRMHKTGGQTTDGFVGGIEEGIPDAQDALEALVMPPDAPTVGAPRAGAKSGGAASANFAGANFNFYGVKDTEHANQLFEATLTRLIEGDVLQLGGELGGEPA